MRVYELGSELEVYKTYCTECGWRSPTFTNEDDLRDWLTRHEHEPHDHERQMRNFYQILEESQRRHRKPFWQRLLLGLRILRG